MTQNNATIVLTPEAVQHGYFEAITAPGVALSSFLSGKHDLRCNLGRMAADLAPSYQIATRHTALLHAYSVAQVNFLGYLSSVA